MLLNFSEPPLLPSHFHSFWLLLRVLFLHFLHFRLEKESITSSFLFFLLSLCTFLFIATGTMCGAAGGFLSMCVHMCASHLWLLLELREFCSTVKLRRVFPTIYKMIHGNPLQPTICWDLTKIILQLFIPHMSEFYPLTEPTI